MTWDYCECGCKCYVLEGTSFHMYNDLKGGFTLFEGRERLNVKKHRSFEAADRDARKRIRDRARSMS
jgi:hypothetical protein